MAETREIRTPRETARTVRLPTPDETLSVLNFTPDSDAVLKANRESARVVLDSFGVSDSPDRILSDVLEW